MKTEYENLKVTSPAPGHYIIDGLPSGHTQTEEGRLVHPMSVHIPPTLPSGLLLDIIRDRGEPLTATEVVARNQVAKEEQAANPLLVMGEDGGVSLAGVKDSEDISDSLVRQFNDLVPVLTVLRTDGTKRIKDLAEASGVSVERIKELSGQGFEIGAAGWVKLKEGGEA